MYCEYFGLKEKPFSLAPDPRFLYMSQQHWEAIAHLKYGIDDDWGFVLITGDIGTGKTTLCRFLIDQLSDNTEVAFVINPKLTVEELLGVICEEFKIPYPEGNKSIKVFIDLINAFLISVHSSARKALLIIDEAQCLSEEVLEQLRLLTNLETNENKLLRIILLGQPELLGKLSKPELKQMAQRITARYHIGPLLKEDVAAYVSHRLRVAGARESLFSPSAIKRLFRLSNGVPRLINVICDRALLGASLQEHKQVAGSTLEKAAKEVFRHEDSRKFKYRKLSVRLMLALFFLFVIFGSVVLIYKERRALSDTYNKRTETVYADTFKIMPYPADQHILHLFEGSTVFRGRDMVFNTLLKEKGFLYESLFCPDVDLMGFRCLSKENMRDKGKVIQPVSLKLQSKDINAVHSLSITTQGKSTNIPLGSNVQDTIAENLFSSGAGDSPVLQEKPIESSQMNNAGEKQSSFQDGGK